jgi:hypothetical protein
MYAPSFDMIKTADSNARFPLLHFPLPLVPRRLSCRCVPESNSQPVSPSSNFSRCNLIS